MSGQRHVVIVTGWRDWPEELRPVVYRNLTDQYILHGPFVLLHGACTPRGSDEMVGADRYADDWGSLFHPDVDLRRRPANWDKWGNAAGPLRNAAMVREARSLAPVKNIHGLAFPGPTSRGTRNCVRLMEDADIHVETWDVQRAREWLAEGAHRC